MPHLKYQVQKRIMRLISKHYRGLGIDSPYIYHLVRNVIEVKMHYYSFKKMDRQCQNMLPIIKDKLFDESLNGEETIWYKSEYEHLKDCTKLNRFLFRFLNFVNPKRVAFVGDDSGLNLTYLAKVDTRRSLYCLGARAYVQSFSQSILNEQGVSNLKFSKLDSSNNAFDLIQLSREIAPNVLLEFENNLDQYLNEEAYLIIENINKDEERNLLWNRLKGMERFNVSLDLFDIGILIARKGLKKQDYNLSARSYK